MSHPLAQIAFRVSLALATIGLGGAVLAAVVGLVAWAVLPSRVEPVERAEPVVASVPPDAATRVCGKEDVVPAGGQDYVALNNVWAADTAQCVSVGDQSLRVDIADHARAPEGVPAASPVVVHGCHWGDCSRDSALPLRVAGMPEVTADWASTQVESGAYNAVCVVWFHSRPTADGAPDGAELNIWLRSRGGVRPTGALVSQGVGIAGARWNVWFDRTEGRNRMVYERVGEVTSVEGLDIGAFTRDAVARGWVRPEWYLIGVEGGFNLWRGGAGNAVDRFEVSVGDPSTRATALGGDEPPGRPPRRAVGR